MGLIIDIEGGYADNHKIPLSDMAKLSDSIQSISKNYEIKAGKKIYTDIYINANEKGSFQIILDLLQDEYVKGVVTGLATTYFTGLSKDIKSFILYTDKKLYIEELINDVYNLSIELADAEYYDYKMEQKKQLLEEKERCLNAEFSTFNSIKKISSLVKNTNEELSLKPDKITFKIEDNNIKEEINFNMDTRQEIQAISNNIMSLDDIIVKGIPIIISKESNNFFKIKAPFFGTLKIYANKAKISMISTYFNEEKAVTIKINPILKMGELVKTKEAKLIEIIE